MARRSSFGGRKPPRIANPFKPARGKRNPFAASPAPPPPPAPRRHEFERILCEAIQARRLVSLRYDDDLTARLYQPEGVFHSTKGKVCVSGVQINNPAEPFENNEPWTLEVGKMTFLTMTDQQFQFPPRFDRSDDRYRNGIICSV